MPQHDSYIQQQDLPFFVADMIRLLTVYNPQISNGGPTQGSTGPASSATTIPSNAASSPNTPANPETSFASGSGVFSPLSIPTASPTTTPSFPTTVSAATSSAAPPWFLNPDEVLSATADCARDLVTGNHAAWQGAPLSYLLATSTNRYAFCDQILQLILVVLPKVMQNAMAVSIVAANTTSPNDPAATIVSPTATSASGIGYGSSGLDPKAVLYQLVLLHCVDFPRVFFDQVIIRRAVLANSAAHKKLFPPKLHKAIGRLQPHSLLHRSCLLHVYCKEMMEDVNNLFPGGGSGATPERVRTELVSWARHFSTKGLEGGWRPTATVSGSSSNVPTLHSGGGSGYCSVLGQTVVSVVVEPYPPAAVIDLVFALVAPTVSLLEADSVATLFIHSDAWASWVTQRHLRTTGALLTDCCSVPFS